MNNYCLLLLHFFPLFIYMTLKGHKTKIIQQIKSNFLRHTFIIKKQTENIFTFQFILLEKKYCEVSI